MNFSKYKGITRPYDVLFFKLKYRKNLKRFLVHKSKSLGRSNGSIVSWHRGGGSKRNYRILFEFNNNCSKYALLRSIEYDPNRTAFIGLAQLQNGTFINMLVNSSAKVGDVVKLTDNVNEFNRFGDFIKLRYAPIGVPIYNLEKFPGSGPIFSKSAGVSSLLLTKDLNYGKIKLPSGEERLFDLDCMVTLGLASNVNKRFFKNYKAGNSRLNNKRPVVRGVAMNPVDHPHGGGAGKTKGGRPSVSPWGKLTKGVPTRKKGLKNKFIVKRK